MISLNTESIEQAIGQRLSEFQKVVLRASMVMINSRVRPGKTENQRSMGGRSVLPEKIGERLEREVRSMRESVEEDDREKPELDISIDALDPSNLDVDETIYYFVATVVESEPSNEQLT